MGSGERGGVSEGTVGRIADEAVGCGGVIKKQNTKKLTSIFSSE